jgi:hypothetical protein
MRGTSAQEIESRRRKQGDEAAQTYLPLHASGGSTSCAHHLTIDPLYRIQHALA